MLNFKSIFTVLLVSILMAQTVQAFNAKLLRVATAAGVIAATGGYVVCKDRPMAKPDWALKYLPNGVPSQLADQVEFLKNPERFTKLGATLPKGILLYGPPGTGKTTIARAIAKELDATFIAASATDLTAEYYGLGSRLVKELFKDARDEVAITGRCVLFIDEIDIITPRRDSPLHKAYGEQTTELLDQLDGFKELKGVYVIGATNKKESIDPAVLRGGRLETHILIPLPDEEGRADIIAHYLTKIVYTHKRKRDGVDIVKILAAKTEGFSGAQLKKLVNDAVILAASEQARAVTNEHLLQAFEELNSTDEE